MKITDRRISLLLFTYFACLATLLIFTNVTKYNMAALQFDLNESTRVIRFEKGIFEKEIIDVNISDDNSLHVLKLAVSIAKANDLWKINIYIISLLTAGFIGLFIYKLRFKKWFIAGYALILGSFIIWNAATIQEIIEDIQRYINLIK